MIRGLFAVTPEVGIGLVNRIDAETDRLRRRRPDWCGEGAAGRARRRRLARSARKRHHHGGRAGGEPGDRLAGARPWPHPPGERSHLVGGGPIPPRIARTLLAIVLVKAVLTDGVAVQQVRHFGRRIPAEVRIALELGPPPEFAGVTCAELGRDRRYNLDWDHVGPVAKLPGRPHWRTLVPSASRTTGRKPDATVPLGSSERRLFPTRTVGPRAPMTSASGPTERRTRAASREVGVEWV